MIAAQKFYEKYGFTLLDKPLLQTEHFACDVRYMKELTDKEQAIKERKDN